MSRFKFVILSKDDDFKISKESADACASRAEFKFIAGNKRPLAEVYNENFDGDYDYIVFMHSDVKLSLDCLMDHVEAVAGKYDLMGLCGCQFLSVGQSPLNWFCGSRHRPEGRWGCVQHGEIGSHTSYFSSEFPEVTDHEVSCIDGLCIIMSRRAVDAGMRFDPSVGQFNCYDTDISLQAVLNYRFKVGVLVRRDLFHYSVGKQILGRQFAENELALRRKWNFDIPAGSAVEKLVTETVDKA